MKFNGNFSRFFNFVTSQLKHHGIYMDHGLTVKTKQVCLIQIFLVSLLFRFIHLRYSFKNCECIYGCIEDVHSRCLFDEQYFMFLFFLKNLVTVRVV